MLRGRLAQLTKPAVEWMQEEDVDKNAAPLDSEQQRAIIERFWHDKQQQDGYWKAILWLTAAALLLFLLSLYTHPFYSPLHSAFTLQLSAAFPSFPSFPSPTLPLLLLLLSALTSASLPTLFTSSRTPHSTPFTSTLPFRIAALCLLPIVLLPLFTSLSKQRPSFLALLPFTLATLHFLLSTYALHTSHRLARTLHSLTKLQYTFHSLYTHSPSVHAPCICPHSPPTAA